MTVPFRVFVIDEHPVVRAGLAQLFASSSDYLFCGAAANASEARAAVAQRRPDLIVLELLLGGIERTALIAELHELHPAGRILVFTTLAEKLFARRTLRAGAHGYLVKTAGLEAVREALAALARGELSVSVAVVNELVEAGMRDRRTVLDELSDRELQVLRLVAAGRELGEIAGELNLSVKTVGTYRERLKNKLGVESARLLAQQAEAILSASEVFTNGVGAARESRAQGYFC